MKLYRSLGSTMLIYIVRLLAIRYFALDPDVITLVIHWPAAFAPGNGFNPPHPTKPNELAIDKETSLVDTWKAMIKLPKSKVRSIGVSNFTIAQIDGIIAATGVVPVSLHEYEAL